MEGADDASAAAAADAPQKQLSKKELRAQKAKEMDDLDSLLSEMGIDLTASSGGGGKGSGGGGGKDAAAVGGGKGKGKGKKDPALSKALSKDAKARADKLKKAQGASKKKTYEKTAPVKPAKN